MFIFGTSYRFDRENKNLVQNQASYGEKNDELIDQINGINSNVENLGGELDVLDEIVHTLDDNVNDLNGSLNSFQSDLVEISSNLSSVV